jgi:formylglycine-generating enzyme required for sulfatase activity
LTPAAQENLARKDPLWQFIVDELPESLRDFSQPLRAELLNTGGLLLLDGLDEVPEADHRRVEVKAAVEQFAAAFPKVRVLVTSRTYAYQKQDWKLRGFSEVVLAPFGAAQIRRFVERWYAFVGQARNLAEGDAQGRAALLNNAIGHNPRLYELATRPLLLTLMASLHAWRGGTLPDQREELYADAVTLLLDQWESQKVKRRAHGTFEVSEPSLLEWLRADQKAMRQLLNQLAYAAHRDQPTLVGTADIKQDTLVSSLMKLNLNPDARPQRLIEYLRDRAGLLEPRGVGIYAFPHRTFQEYLAACHLTERDDFLDNIAELLRAEPNRWREVILLAGAKATRGATANAWLLAEALCFTSHPTEKMADESGYWGALLAAQVLIENRSLEQVSERNRPKVERIRQWLTRTLIHGALPPIDRAQAGDALAIFGDPRFRVEAWFLPDEPLVGFVEIPAGPFLMGSDKKNDPQTYDNETPQHTLTLPGYYLSRYPVTVAQFRAFVEQSGYEPEDPDSLRGLANHPVVYISWYEAVRYCQWLTEHLREWPDTPEPLATLLRKEGWQVMLPSEAEWEKAAGGPSTGSGDGRIYPWGDEFDANRANTSETRIDELSAVGCFPQGASPYGCLDMAGNVWEWTRSLWGKDYGKPDFRYPYDPGDGRERLDAPNNVLRVLRGGAFWGGLGDARCAARRWHYPDSRNDHRGFRVVVRPCMDSETRP